MYLKEIYHCQELGGKGELLFNGYKILILKGEFFFNSREGEKMKHKCHYYKIEKQYHVPK